MQTKMNADNQNMKGFKLLFYIFLLALMLNEAYYLILRHCVFYRFEQLFDEFALN